MKVKRIYVEAKKSLNFQTYTVGLDIEVADYEDYKLVVETAQNKAREMVLSEIAKDKR